MEEKKGHIILSTEPGSIAEELELMAGDSVVSINGKTIEDIIFFENYFGGSEKCKKNN